MREVTWRQEVRPGRPLTFRHLTLDGHRTLCGVKIPWTWVQRPLGSSPCRSCTRVAAARIARA